MTAGIHSYFPFQAVSFTRPLLSAGPVVGISGMIMVMLSWGFFEGFTFVVISDRINKLLPPKNLLGNWGAAVSGLACLLLHTALGLPPETFWAGLCDFILIYGMLVIKDYTGNAWGCVFIFFFLWNAII